MTESQRSDKYIHGLVDAFVEMATRSFDEEIDPIAKGYAASNLVRHSMLIASHLCGEAMLKMAYGETVDIEDRPAALQLLADRMALTQNLFWGMDEPEDPGSIAAAIEEITAVANGDAPRLFAKTKSIKGKRRGTYRLALCEFRALEWIAYFENMPGISREEKTDLKNQVPSAFGVESSAMLKWPDRLKDSLGETIFDAAIRSARTSASIGWNLRPSKLSNSEALIADGHAYRSELKAGKTARKD